MDEEWLSPEEIIQELLDSLKETEWIYSYIRCPRGCCGDWEYQCPDCQKTREDGHAEHCQLARRIRLAEAYLQPSKTNGLTAWERIDDETLSDHPT